MDSFFNSYFPNPNSAPRPREWQNPLSTSYVPNPFPAPTYNPPTTFSFTPTQLGNHGVNLSGSVSHRIGEPDHNLTATARGGGNLLNGNSVKLTSPNHGLGVTYNK